ncbi:MAG: ABC transporter transmembrane domain-containing protein [Arenibacterium sp.]
MEPTLFSFIWKHSKRQQLWLFALTLVSFPLLYVSLELPKRIINDAIGATSEKIDVFGYSFGQIEFLLLLCFAFLATVIASGLMKMHINTMKGVLAERLLRRLRYKLISRMMRFPSPYFRTTSQGELVSMITSEAEPMGGLMGDAVAQPAFQFGQMMTILIFLFAQSFWFGLASIALIPLQAWLIPMLQRQINLLNKDRITEIRHFSSEIGETAAGMSDLRANGGWRYRLAQFTDRLGRLFEIRFRIYQKKFFMKFLNNMISHLTPFFFYSVGGVLAIRGDITVGALVAALAAYKDLSSPWKELLFFYNQVQDMSLRWQIVMERFAPDEMLDEKLIEGEPDEIPHLKGEIAFHNVTLFDANGHVVLEDIDLSIPAGARVAIQSTKPSERTAFAQLLMREVLPSCGHISLNGYRLDELHQAVIATRIGYAHSRPYFFDGTLGDNLLMPLRIRPQTVEWDPGHHNKAAIEAKKSGNSADPLASDWTDPGLAGLNDRTEIREWWFKLVEAMGIDDEMVRRAIHSRMDPETHPKFAGEFVALRAEIAARLDAAGLSDYVARFDANEFNPTVPLGGNLLFAAPRRAISAMELAEKGQFLSMLREQGLDQGGLEIAQVVIETLNQTFGRDGTDHPLFRRLGLEEELFQKLTDLAAKRAHKGKETLNDAETALMLAIPFLLTAEQIGDSFPDHYKAEILEMRREKSAQLRAQTEDIFVPITPETYLPRLTIAENLLYGRVRMMAGSKADAIEQLIVDVLSEHQLKDEVAATIYDLQTGLGGANLPTVIQERAAFSRAGIKRPDILLLDKVLASHDSKSRARTRERLRDLLADSTIVFMEDHFKHPESYDLFVEIKDGRIDGIARADTKSGPRKGTADFRQKLKIIANTPLFEALDARNQRLLAFSAQYFDAKQDQVIFARGDQPDAAYLCLEGQAQLRWSASDADEHPVTQVGPGRLIGDLSIIINQERQMDLIALGPCRFLRIGAEELSAVIESDPRVSMMMLRTVSTNLLEAAERIRALRNLGAVTDDFSPNDNPLDMDTVGAGE